MVTQYRGFLKLIVLNELSKNDSTGYSLLSAIETVTGKKPSNGSLYPLLLALELKGFLKSRENGKTKIYSITEIGRKHMEDSFKEREEMMLERMRYLTGISDGCMIGKIFQKKEDPTVLEKNISDWMELKTAALSLLIDKDYEKKRPMIRKVIRGATKELERIRDGDL